MQDPKVFRHSQMISQDIRWKKVEQPELETNAHMGSWCHRWRMDLLCHHTYPKMLILKKRPFEKSFVRLIKENEKAKMTSLISIKKT